MKALNRLLAVLAVLTLPAAALAQAAATDYTFALHGFVSMSAASQSGRFNPSPGQQTLSAGNPALATDKASETFDVRQSRFNFSVKGPQVLFGATPTAVLEMDFFGGNSAGNYGDVSIYPRMRTAYTQLDWGNHKLQIGQQNDLTFAMAPTSLSHIAFPLGYETGNIGWRRPGIFGFHNFPLADDLKLELAWEIGRSQFDDATLVNGMTRGEASGMPALQGRVTVSSKIFTAWVAGHYSAIDTNGAGVADVDPKTITTSAVAAGGKVSYMGLTVAAAGFTGKNTGPLLGQFLNFSVGPAGDEDVSTTGYWAQAGYNFTKEFSLWALYGNQKPKAADATKISLAQRENTTMNFIAMYRDGGFGASLEYVGFKTVYGTYAAGPPVTLASTTSNKASQVILTGTYFF